MRVTQPANSVALPRRLADGMSKKARALIGLAAALAVSGAAAQAAGQSFYAGTAGDAGVSLSTLDEGGKPRSIQTLDWDGLPCGGDVVTGSISKPIRIKRRSFSDRQPVAGVQADLTLRVEGEFEHHHEKARGTLRITGSCNSGPVAFSVRLRKPSDRLLVKLDEFKLSPHVASVKAGVVGIKAKNIGEGEHELVVAASDLKPGKLPTTDRGDVDEDALDVIGEVSETPPGKTGTTKLDLVPGKYVMFCNVPSHYAAGMYGRLNVE